MVCAQMEKVSVQFSRSVLSDSLRPHGLQQARPPCPSPTPRVDVCITMYTYNYALKFWWLFACVSQDPQFMWTGWSHSTLTPQPSIFCPCPLAISWRARSLFPVGSPPALKSGPHDRSAPPSPSSHGASQVPLWPADRGLSRNPWVKGHVQLKC